MISNLISNTWPGSTSTNTHYYQPPTPPYWVNFLFVMLCVVLLFAGAIAKSAQSPRHVWLPDVKEGLVVPSQYVWVFLWLTDMPLTSTLFLFTCPNYLNLGFLILSTMEATPILSQISFFLIYLSSYAYTSTSTSLSPRLLSSAHESSWQANTPFHTT